MCCGQKRSELRNGQTQRTAWTVPRYVPGNSWAEVVRTQPSAPSAMQAVSPYRPANPQTGSIQLQPRTRNSTSHASISVRYLENSPIRVRGLVSGMLYEFSGSREVQQVDARDATSLLKTRFFRRA